MLLVKLFSYRYKEGHVMWVNDGCGTYECGGVEPVFSDALLNSKVETIFFLVIDQLVRDLLLAF